MEEIEIDKTPKDYYSHAGKFSIEKISYLLGKNSHNDKILSRKKVNYDILPEENSNLSLLYGYENIFSDKYQSKHKLELNKQKFKYFDNVKNPCTYIENRVKKNITAKIEKLKKIKIKKDINENNEKKEGEIKTPKENLNKIIAKSELLKIIEAGYNFNYYHHLLHHTYNDNYYMGNNKKEIKIGPDINATRYNPKLDFIYPKIVYSPSFKLMKGRYDKEKLIEKLKNILEQKKNKKNLENKENEELESDLDYIIGLKIKNLKDKKNKRLNKSKSFIDKKYIKENTISINSLKGNNMNENSTKENDNNSGSYNNDTLFTSNIYKNVNYKESNSNDSYIKINMDKNIVLNNAYLTAKLSNCLNNDTNNKNLRKINIFNKGKFPNLFHRKEENNSSFSNFNKSCKNKNTTNKSLINNNSDTNIFTSKEKINRSQNLSKNKSKNEILLSMRGPNFNKMLGREYINRLHLKKQLIHPQLNPNWNSVEPKCVMKVMYSNNLTNKKSMNKFKGMGEEATFDISKIFNNYNNHFRPKYIYFNKMIGRTSNKYSLLPSYMTNLSNRNSCDYISEKSLIMNNYSEGKFKNVISSFNQQKSFNNKLNMNKENLNNSAEIKNNENDALKIFMKMIRNNKNNRKKKIMIPKQDFMSISYKSGNLNGLSEFYKINLDSIKSEKKIDGITYKSFIKTNQREDILSDKDKKIFLINFYNNN